VRHDGQPFRWRGITAFRLLEQITTGKETDVEAYLRWAGRERLTVVRVLAMAKHLFELTPEHGRESLDDLLERAATHNLYVEVVALADTAAYPVSLEAQVRAIGQIAGRHPNAIVEIANEPYHRTQREEVRNEGRLAELSALVPEAVPVAVGAWQQPDAAAAGEFITFHFPRSAREGGWGHVARLTSGHEMLLRYNKPVINDEPIGAGAVLQPGRRDDNPDRFRAAALLTRMIGMGGTFHYEGGLQAQIPAGREMDSFRAWQEAWDHLPDDVETTWEFRSAGDAGAAVERLNGTAAGAWEVQRGDEAWVLVAGGRENVSLEWAPGWRQVDVITWAESRLVRAARTRS
jgi:hypothetical protein